MVLGYSLCILIRQLPLLREEFRIPKLFCGLVYLKLALDGVRMTPTSLIDCRLLTAGVRQGGVLSPYFFAIFVDDIVNKIIDCNTGRYVRNICISIFLYADDIILLCPSIGGLQRLVRVCEQAIEEIGMKINAAKTVCMLLVLV